MLAGPRAPGPVLTLLEGLARLEKSPSRSPLEGLTPLEGLARLGLYRPRGEAPCARGSASLRVSAGLWSKVDAELSPMGSHTQIRPWSSMRGPAPPFVPWRESRPATKRYRESHRGDGPFKAPACLDQGQGPSHPLFLLVSLRSARARGRDLMHLAPLVKEPHARILVCPCA